MGSEKSYAKMTAWQCIKVDTTVGHIDLLHNNNNPLKVIERLVHSHFLLFLDCYHDDPLIVTEK